MKKFGLFLLDIGALYGALIITLFIRYRVNFGEQYAIHILPFSFIFCIWLLVFYITNLYDISSLRNSVYFYSDLFRSIAFASIISVFFFYLIPIFDITPKTNLAFFIILFSGLVTGIRTLYNRANEKGSKKLLMIVDRKSVV